MASTADDLGRRWFEEVWNRGRREAIAEMIAPDGVIHDGATDSTGPEGFYPFFDRMHETFSDIRLTLEDTIAESDAACVRWSCTMKHTGGGLGILQLVGRFASLAFPYCVRRAAKSSRLGRTGTCSG